jgi:L-fucose mutarotase/ribose pyranase (RbsD/FucU family)
MYYKFGSHSGDDIANKIDTQHVSDVLDNLYQLNEIEDYDARALIMKELIKNKKEFTALKEQLNTEYEDLIDSIVRLYPYKVFTHHMIKFIKVNYLDV